MNSWSLESELVLLRSVIAHELFHISKKAPQWKSVIEDCRKELGETSGVDLSIPLVFAKVRGMLGGMSRRKPTEKEMQREVTPELAESGVSLAWRIKHNKVAEKWQLLKELDEKRHKPPPTAAALAAKNRIEGGPMPDTIITTKRARKKKRTFDDASFDDEDEDDDLLDADDDDRYSSYSERNGGGSEATGGGGDGGGGGGEGKTNGASTHHHHSSSSGRRHNHSSSGRKQHRQQQSQHRQNSQHHHPHHPNSSSHYPRRRSHHRSYSFSDSDDSHAYSGPEPLPWASPRPYTEDRARFGNGTDTFTRMDLNVLREITREVVEPIRELTDNVVHPMVNGMVCMMQQFQLHNSALSRTPFEQTHRLSALVKTLHHSLSSFVDHDHPHLALVQQIAAQITQLQVQMSQEPVGEPDTAAAAAAAAAAAGLSSNVEKALSGDNNKANNDDDIDDDTAVRRIEDLAAPHGTTADVDNPPPLSSVALLDHFLHESDSTAAVSAMDVDGSRQQQEQQQQQSVPTSSLARRSDKSAE